MSVIRARMSHWPGGFRASPSHFRKQNKSIQYLVVLQGSSFRGFATEVSPLKEFPKKHSNDQSPGETLSPFKNVEQAQATPNSSLPAGWEDKTKVEISKFSELPHKNFGFNQHMIINVEFKEALRQVLWQFRAPIRYAFAYGSGVFSQSSGASSSYSAKTSPHPDPPDSITKWQKTGGKSIDFIFGVSYSQHWHSLNLQQHRNHYSFLGGFGSNVVTKVQDNFGAGAYFNPYVVVNGMMIKYGVVNLDTLYRDLSEWDTLYLAGRLHKPVKILRDDPRIRLANQRNLISALRAALLMLPETFTENELYNKIASISYIGDPRMKYGAENPRKVADIVDNQLVNFRQLYLPLIDDLPNISFNDPNVKKDGWVDSADLNCRIQQDMNPIRRGNMVRRLPGSFRKKLYNEFQTVLHIPNKEFMSLLEETKDDASFSSRMGTEFDRKIASSDQLGKVVRRVVKQTIKRPSTIQSLKGILTAGPIKGWKYLQEKREKGRAKRSADAQKDDNQKDEREKT